MTTVKDLIEALSKMPEDAHVILRGSDETYDGYSHPFVELDADGEVVIREADDQDWWLSARRSPRVGGL